MNDAADNADERAKAIAFYLPQYHPIAENDEWWGKGFTEWTNVTKAQPQFPGHHQPHLPGELGFYDLRVAETRVQQAALARSFGLHGFCYYYYWFDGRRLLERPLDEVLASGEPGFPFCICWANENWTRRWDGAEHEVLISQSHSEDSDRRFIRDVIPILRDRRYIRVHGAPLLLVYRPQLLPNARVTTAIWREVARELGIERLHLAAVQSCGLKDPRPLGFDSAVEFPPHGVFGQPAINGSVPGLSPRFAGEIHDYRNVVRAEIARPRSREYTTFRGVMTSWDNTPRRGPNAHLFAHATAYEYEVWLRAALAATEAANAPGERFVFINAWNEWAEGAHLEPDRQNGHAYLEATSRALRQRSDWRALLAAVRSNDGIPADVLRGFVDDLGFALEAYDRSVRYLSESARAAERLAEESRLTVFSDTVPGLLRDRPVPLDGAMRLESVNGAPPTDPCFVERASGARVSGWAFAPEIDAPPGGGPAWFVLRTPDGARSYFAPAFERTRRNDVRPGGSTAAESLAPDYGFDAVLRLDAVDPGEYQLGFVHADDARCAIAFHGGPVCVR
jgi:hypothetical protein